MRARPATDRRPSCATACCAWLVAVAAGALPAQESADVDRRPSGRTAVEAAANRPSPALAVPEHAATLAFLDSLGLPDLATAPLVRATTDDRGSTDEPAAFVGFLADDRGATFSVWVGNPVGWPGMPPPRQGSAHPLARWTGVRSARGTPVAERVGYEPLDFVATVADRLERTRAWLAGAAPAPEPALAARHAPGTDLALWAFAAWRRGRDHLARDLLTTARDAYDHRPDLVAAAGDDLARIVELDLAHAATWEFVEDFADPAQPFSELRARAAAILAHYPHTPHAERLRAAEATLRDQVALAVRSAAEGEAAPDGIAESAEALARRLVLDLETQNGRQPSQPGHPDVWLDPRGASSPAHRLRALGIDAAPALIDAFDDQRFTRTVGFVRNYRFSHRVLRVGEVAREILMRIAGRAFTDTTDATAWLDAVQSDGELAVLTRAARSGDARGLAQAVRLMTIAPQAAIDALEEGARAATGDWVRAAHLRLLADVGAAPDVFQGHLDAPGPSTRFAAAWALRAHRPHASLVALLALLDAAPDRPIRGPEDLPQGPDRATRIVAAAVAGPPSAFDALSTRGVVPTAELALAVRRGWHAPTADRTLVAPDRADWRRRCLEFCLDHLRRPDAWRFDAHGRRSGDHAAAIAAVLAPERFAFDAAASEPERDRAIAAILAATGDG